jgi:hypothetical protein
MVFRVSTEACMVMSIKKTFGFGACGIYMSWMLSAQRGNHLDELKIRRSNHEPTNSITILSFWRDLSKHLISASGNYDIPNIHETTSGWYRR